MFVVVVGNWVVVVGKIFLVEVVVEKYWVRKNGKRKKR